MVTLVVLVEVGLTARISVATESQPATVFKFAVYVPAVPMLLPFQEYGSSLPQMVALVVLVSVALTARSSVAMESQPVALVRFAL